MSRHVHWGVGFAVTFLIGSIFKKYVSKNTRTGKFPLGNNTKLMLCTGVWSLW